MTKHSKLQLRFWLFSTFLFCMSIPAYSASDSSNSNSTSGSFLIRPWAVGQTAIYRTKYFKNDNLAGVETTTYSIVGQETIKGKNYFWLEIEHLWSTGNHSIGKFQVRQYKNIDFENSLLFFPHSLIKRRRLVSSGSHLSESKVSSDALSKIENDPDPSQTIDFSEKFVVTSEEPVTVEAGVFNVEKFRISSTNNLSAGTKSSSISGEAFVGTDTWGSPKIPIVGVVKSIMQGFGQGGQRVSTQTELLSFSENNAVTKISDMPLDPWLPAGLTPATNSSQFPNPSVKKKNKTGS